MRIHRTVLLWLLVLLWASTVGAQTSTRTLVWDQPVATPADAGAYVYTLKIDAAAPVVVPATCASVAAVTQCSTPLVLPAGTSHTLILTASNGFGSASSAPLTGSPPVPAVNIKVIVTVTVP